LVTHKEIPKTEIITEIEKASLTLERQGKCKEADDLRHSAAHILLHAKPPKSNLTAHQKKGLSFFNKNKELFVTLLIRGKVLILLKGKN
jgi:hypothetical protein